MDAAPCCFILDSPTLRDQGSGDSLIYLDDSNDLQKLLIRMGIILIYLYMWDFTDDDKKTIEEIYQPSIAVALTLASLQECPAVAGS